MLTELVIVVFVTVLVFGATKIPALGDALGRAVRGFRREVGDEAETGDAARKDRPAARG
jgi:sec-independent protein translocase protein TatA